MDETQEVKQGFWRVASSEVNDDVTVAVFHDGRGPGRSSYAARLTAKEARELAKALRLAAENVEARDADARAERDYPLNASPS
jgi:hypothetical protein